MKLENTHSFQTIDQAKNFIKVFEATNGVRFTSIKTTIGFGNFDKSKPGERTVYVPDELGYAIMKVGTKVLQCRHKESVKTEWSPSTSGSRDLSVMEREYHENNEKKRKLQNRSERCPAKILIKEVAHFPDYKPEGNTKLHKRDVSCSLRLDLCDDPSKVQTFSEFQCELPDVGDHSEGHNIGKVIFMHQHVETYLTSEIQRLAEEEGITDPAEVKARLMRYVEALTVIPVDETSGKLANNEEDVYNRIMSAKRLKTCEELEGVVVIQV